jgi:AcrR family transcriptional regulator
MAQALACFNQQGLELTTIDMIRDACQTSVGNIYHHFGNKDGLIAALFLSGMADQHRLLEGYLEKAHSSREGVAAMVFSFLDWVVEQPDYARFQFQARYHVAKGEHAQALSERNRARRKMMQTWLGDAARRSLFEPWPPELVPSLIIGPVENYCRAWLSGRVSTSPAQHREALAEAAWQALQAGSGV